MAGDSGKEEFPPLLLPGFYDLGIDGLERLCVTRFPQSVTRKRIFDNLSKIVSQIQQNGMKGEVWIDGSFLTEKLNPDDSDIILVVDSSEHSKMDANQRKYFDWFNAVSLYDNFRCDNYTLIRDNSAFGEWNYAYWLRQFGFSRADQMKGLAVIKVPFLVTL